MEEISPKKSELKKSCINCGAELVYAPGTTELKCDYCGYTETIAPSETLPRKDGFTKTQRGNHDAPL